MKIVHLSRRWLHWSKLISCDFVRLFQALFILSFTLCLIFCFFTSSEECVSTKLQLTTWRRCERSEKNSFIKSNYFDVGIKSHFLCSSLYANERQGNMKNLIACLSNWLFLNEDPQIDSKNKLQIKFVASNLSRTHKSSGQLLWVLQQF